MGPDRGRSGASLSSNTNNRLDAALRAEECTHGRGVRSTKRWWARRADLGCTCYVMNTCWIMGYNRWRWRGHGAILLLHTHSLALPVLFFPSSSSSSSCLFFFFTFFLLLLSSSFYFPHCLLLSHSCLRHRPLYVWVLILY